ncbi:MAG: type I restriction endonuclease subunit S [Verrucomicrobiota bacterium]|jgi:type I restriction enzyme S subunit
MATGKTQKQSSGGSALGFEAITRCKVALPPEILVAKFSELIQPLIGRIIANIDESRTLAALRDALLPKLLSGELRVLAAVKLVEATA